MIRLRSHNTQRASARQVRLRSLAAIAAILVLVAPIVAAHELGKTQVTATVVDGRYSVDIAVDPDALVTRLEVFSGGELTATSSTSSAADLVARDRRIVSLKETFLDHVVLAFDGQRVRPEFAYAPDPSGVLASSVRLTGPLPPHAKALTFSYGLALGSYAFVLNLDRGVPQTMWLDGPQAEQTVLLEAAQPPSRLAIVWQYAALGFTHILPKGLDHILFVIGIFLLSARWRSILTQVSAFTIAHSITLGLSMYGVVSLPSRVVEPLIALSIAYVAIENLATSHLHSWRVVLVFVFGLLHGMGFAGVLGELGLPRSEFVTALLSFNAGVEAGQLTVNAIAFATVAYWRRNSGVYRRYIVQPASVAIAVVGVFWTIQRIL